MNFLLNLLTSQLSDCCLFSCLKGKPGVFAQLPEELTCKILVEYLPDQVGNRLLSKRIRNELDKKYDEITGQSSGLRRKRGLINLEALVLLKTDTTSLDPIRMLKCENINIRVVIRLMKELKWRLPFELSHQLSLQDVQRIFFEGCNDPDEYNQVSRTIFNYHNFRTMLERCERLDPRIIREYERLLQIQKEEMYLITYSIIYRRCL